jgi:threonine synthase
VAYDLAGWRAAGLLDAWRAEWRQRAGGVWRFRELLPLPPGAAALSLDEGATPLTRLEGPGPGRIWLKEETRNPTGAFKDRLHAVGLAMARHLGFPRATAATTGNHGTALAAYAARAGLEALVFCDPGAPEVQRRLMAAFGARVVVLAEREEHLAWLARERGWFPSVGLWPDPVGNPYGVEGYKTIAYEAYLQLGRFPDRVLAPTAGGDALYGPWKGFRELAALGAPGRRPRMVAVQAAGCAPVVEAWRRGAAAVGVHPGPRTIARSIGDATGGPLSLDAIAASGGGAEAVPDRALVAAMGRLAAQGIAVEPSGAAGVAAALALRARGELAEGEDVVCVLTGAGMKWPATVARGANRRELRDADPAAVRAWVEASPRGEAAAPGRGDEA